ncbi:MAG: transcriptional repressor [Phycisphaerales bacterium]|nr:transcriptional repressor [Phycisphaerales bacterium]
MQEQHLQGPPVLSDEHIRSAFRRRGLRFTRQRASIFRALASTTSHPTADELLTFVRDEDPRVSLATIYNTLEVFTDSGLCRRLPGALASSACRYDADTRHHVHLIADNGQIMDVPPELGAELMAHLSSDTVAEIERRLGVKVTRVDLRLIGQIAPNDGGFSS